MTRGGLVEDSKVKARVICNPASSGGGYDPEELQGELEGYELEWITTQSPGDAAEAAAE
jgi:diacylglycerol kinase family enzyme